MSNATEAYRMMEEWLSWMEHRGRRPKTLKTYRSSLRNVIYFLDGNGMECRPDRMEEDDVYYLVNHYIATENTVRYYVTVLGEWTKYYNNRVLKSMGLLWNNNGTPNAKWIYRYEFNKMLSHCCDPTERLILLLGGFCGLRRAEISGLRMCDYDGKKLIVTGKGHRNGKTREIPLTDVMRKEVDDYIRKREDIIGDRILRNEGSLLICPVGKNYIHKVLPDHVGLIVKGIAARSGIPCTTHSLRRMFATSLFDAKIEPPVVQHLMGHENIETTFRYFRKDEARMRNAMETFKL